MGSKHPGGQELAKERTTTLTFIVLSSSSLISRSSGSIDFSRIEGEITDTYYFRLISLSIYQAIKLDTHLCFYGTKDRTQGFEKC